jgi:dihydroorotase
VFEEEDALDRLEAFAALNGPKHYRLPPNEGTITLECTPWTAPDHVGIADIEERVTVYHGGETLPWRVMEE